VVLETTAIVSSYKIIAVISRIVLVSHIPPRFWKQPRCYPLSNPSTLSISFCFHHTFKPLGVASLGLSPISRTRSHGHSLPSSPSLILTQDDLKKIATYKAVEYVKSGMVFDLGTSSIAKHIVDRIGKLLRQGKLKDIVGIPTSKMTHKQTLSLGIPLSNLDSHPVVDLAIDGADEVDPFLNLVKGRGGSLHREKMVVSVCKTFIVIVDESKLVKYLGGSGLAMSVEVIQFC